MDMLILGREDVRTALSDDVCIALMRDAMVALSSGETRQVPRQIIPLARGLFGTMAGAVGEAGSFGAKVLSIFPGNIAKGGQSHQGAMVMFDPDDGALSALLHAGEVTGIRTAAASAAATDVLARTDARRLAVLGTGEQAERHIAAIARIRPLTSVTVWGRDSAKTNRLAAHIEQQIGLNCRGVATVAEAVGDADIVCTVTGAKEPILFADQIAPGTHINVVGSSHAGPAEIDNELVRRARFFGDSRDNVLSQGAEFILAREAGLIADDHFLAEIGAVYAGGSDGRTRDDDVTIYKSLGHIVQDLAAASEVVRVARAQGMGTAIGFR